MIGMVLVTHGRLAIELLNAAETITGEIDHIAAVSLGWHDDVGTAATMVQKAVSGENVGEMFITDPQPDEYKLYLQAKREREAAELEAAEKAKAKAAAAAKTSGTPAAR